MVTDLMLLVIFKISTPNRKNEYPRRAVYVPRQIWSRGLELIIMTLYYLYLLLSLIYWFGLLFG